MGRNLAGSCITLGLVLCWALSACAQVVRDPPASQPQVPMPQASSIEDPQAKPLVPKGQVQEVVSLIERQYIRPVAKGTLERFSRERKLELLDPYSSYLDPTTLAYFDRDLEGVFGGVGVHLDETPTDTGFRVVGPMFGSPAQAAGVRAGDVILAVDGHATREWTIDQMIAAMQGAPGTVVAIEVQSETGDLPRRILITRASISVTTVRGLHLDLRGSWQYLFDPGGTAYVRITSFAETTVADFDRALDAIHSTSATGLVIDLRGNDGGLSSAAVAISDRLIDAGRIVKYRSRQGQEVEEGTPGMRTRLPIAVLVDAETMSAAEILVAALQDHHRARVIGARTYGKATVQKIFRLRGGGAVKLAIAVYERPSGAPIERHALGGDTVLGGVWPDPGMAIQASHAQWEKWREETWKRDALATLAIGEPAQPPLTDDPFIEQALAWLEQRTAH